jgi:23S rRNA pseudouridine2604 synthase
MATLKLNKKPSPGTPEEAGTPQRRRAPVRNATPRKQLTLAQAQAERAAREAAYQANAPKWRGRDEAPRDPGARPPRRDDTRPARSAERPPRPAPGMGAGPAWSGAPAPRQVPADPRGRGPQERRPPPPFGRDTEDPRAPRRMPPAAPGQRRERSTLMPSPRAAEGERLSKRMTALGLASRREADDWIAAGWVRVDGRLAVLGQRVRPDVRIDIDPAASRQQAQRMTVLLNKPVGYVSGQAEDGYEPAVVLVRPENRWAEDKSGISFHPGHLRSLVPAGRLDIDSVGLLVLTQDGRIAKHLIGEDARVEKEYLVRVAYQREGTLPDSAMALLQHGLELDGVALRPAKVSWQNEDQLRFVLREGRKRQIRRMCEAVGLQVLGLKRVRIGSVALGPLPPGQWRYLRWDEKF